MNNISITSEFFRAMGYIIIAAIVYFLYKTGRDGISGRLELNEEDLLSRLFKGFAILLTISFFAAYVILGKSNDCTDSDPLYGTCNTVQDYKPSSEMRFISFIYYITLLGVPYLAGGCSGYNSIKSGKAQEKYNDEQGLIEKRNRKINREILREMKIIKQRNKK